MMGETTINPKTLENAVLKALSTPFPNLATSRNAGVEFYAKFQRVADDYDRPFIKKYDEDLNSTLIFAGLFSAVTSAFIIDVQSKLEPDYEEMNHVLLKIIASAALGNTPTGADVAFPQWDGPNPTIIHVQAILYSSLSASLLAAFIAMLGKQWLNRYASAEHGTTIDRGRDRKRKMDGMVTWQFGLVMECLPLMLQAALLLLGCALSDYLYFINRVVASVLIGFTTFGLLFYLLIVSAATLSYNCPFQTPLSHIFRFMIRFDNKHKKYLERSGKWFGHIFSRMKNKNKQKPTLGSPYGLNRFSTPDGNSFWDHIGLPMSIPFDQPPPIFDVETDWSGYVLDSDCIALMFEMPMDIDVTMAIARFIPEIVWHADIRSIPLERLYDTFLECFDRSSGRPIVKPVFRDMAYLSAKAFIHVVIQRKCIGDGSENVVFDSILRRHQMVGFGHYKEDSDLESALGIIDRVFGDCESSMDWQNFSFTVPHHAWMGHTLLYCAWDALRKGEPLPDNIREFILHSLRLDPPPPAPVVADCLFMIGLAFGIKLHVEDLLVVDKSHEVGPQINKIYEKLTWTFSNPISITDEIDRALEVMELIAPLSENEIAQRSYHLFRVVMKAPVFLAYSQEMKWEASRLALHGAYKWDKFLPWVGDPQDILTFLGHHFDLVGRGGRNQHVPIQNALRALVHAPGPATIEALGRFDPTQPSFVRGICHVFQDDKPFRLHKAALFFLPLIGDRWFNTPHPIMEPDQMRSLCMDWASVVERIEHTYDVQKAILAVLLRMINSPHWCPHIVPENWRLLEYFTLVPDDDAPLRSCLDNPELVDAIKDVEHPDALVLWLVILCWKHEELIPQVQEQLETVMKEIVPGDSRSYLDMCLLVVDSRLKKAKDALQRDTNQWSTDPAANALRTKIDHLQLAKVSLVALRGN